MCELQVAWQPGTQRNQQSYLANIGGSKMKEEIENIQGVDVHGEEEKGSRIKVKGNVLRLSL